MVAATIANGGVVMRPYVVERVVAPGRLRRSTTTKPDTLGRAVGAKHAAEVDADDGGGRPAAAPGPRRRSRASGSPARREPPRAASQGTNTTSFIVLRARRQPARRRRRHPRAPERHRRHDRGADRQADHGSADSGDDASDTLINMLFDGRYRIVRKLGSGGMADVYLAEDEELGRRVAIKILNDRHANDESVRRALPPRGEERRRALAPEHRLDLRPRRGRGHLLHRDGVPRRAEPEGARRRARAAADPRRDRVRRARCSAALRFAHRKGVVHRDIKPHNVMADADGRLKVTDFGIARAGVSQMTEAGSIIGTAQYLSPEQARGRRGRPALRPLLGRHRPLRDADRDGAVHAATRRSRSR